MPSLVFDRAVSFYDKTRADPEWVARAGTDSLIRLAQITPASRVLEIGIGTGRIALPLFARGIGIAGVDLSRAMMAELQKKIAGQDFRVALAQTDANVEIARWREPATLARLVDGLAARRVSETWLIPDDTLARIIPAFREWAQAEFGDLSRETQEPESFAWIVARKSA